jgi:hypothetical protein
MVFGVVGALVGVLVTGSATASATTWTLASGTVSWVHIGEDVSRYPRPLEALEEVVGS